MFTQNKGRENRQHALILTPDQRLKQFIFYNKGKIEMAQTKEMIIVHTDCCIHSHFVVEGGTLTGRIACSSSSKYSSQVCCSQSTLKSPHWS